MRIITAELVARPIIEASIAPRAPTIDCAIMQAILIGGAAAAPYEGSYRFTPQGVAQVVPTRNRTLREDIVIEPIPSNYGLITYNGFHITVS
ncbi:MAG: hypothetical protein Q4C56_04165 [Peptococcaceae bacterium]|nr:hypothetical protein [Peptococcaceae bacterium]